ncbi:ABC transporter permease [Candidatus Latescibacterota bacterium]
MLEISFMAMGGLVLLFIVAPIVGMFIHCSTGEIVDAAGDAVVQKSIWLTLWTSMAGTLILGFFAIPFSFLLARKNFPLKRLVTGIIDLPVIIPHSAAGIAVLGVISRNSFIGKLADKIGFSFIGNPAGITIAMAFVSIPFLVNYAREGFAAVPERLEKAALTLGASPVRVFFTISLPLAWRAVLSGLVMMWARGLSEFGAVIIVAYQPMITPVLIYERFSSFGLKYARPVTVLFIIVCLIIFLFLRLLLENKNARS